MAIVRFAFDNAGLRTLVVGEDDNSSTFGEVAKGMQGRNNC